MKTILLVEDTSVLANEIADVLKMEEFGVIIANNGKEALMLLEHFTPDLIITDLLMPGVNGFELIENIKKIEKLRDIPIIILSAKTDVEARERSKALGVNDYIKKPCKPETLVRAVEGLTS